MSLLLAHLFIQLVVLATQSFQINVNPAPSPSAEVFEARGYTGLLSGPYFDISTPTNITAQLGTHAFLPCEIRQLGNKSVSWIRQRDSHILTVDRYTFIADERFQVLHNNEIWTLQIKYVQSRDAGIYECQITTEPKMSWLVNLKVVVPQTKILGESDVFVKSGSTVQLKCVITQNIEQPSYIFWYHENERVLANDNRKLQWVERVTSNTTIGTLVIKSTVFRDSGNYTCSPTSIESASAILHILNGEHPAAMQQGSNCSRIQPIAFYHVVFLYFLMFLFTGGFQYLLRDSTLFQLILTNKSKNKL